MIEKHSHIPAFDPIHGQNVFILGGEFEKTASIVKVAQVSDDVAKVITSLEPADGIRHVLMNGIGAGEFWSSNRNGDFFNETGLKHAGEDYGYSTFMKAHNFVHHNNKDPKVAVGNVKFASYNPRMHRVELIVATDLDKLGKADQDLYEKVANGEPVDVSMGSKCDFDVCSICSKRSATRAEYCGHLKEAMNQTLEDGRKIYAYTPHPRFFDISYVTKGADVTAKALQYLDKKASDGTVKKASEHLGEIRTCPDPSLHEEVSCEEGYTVPEFKASEKFAVHVLEAVELTIPKGDLNKMAEVGLTKVLSTASHMGVILKPEEYQRVALVHLGQEKIADRLEAERAVIDPADAGSWFDPKIQVIHDQVDPDQIDPKVAEIIAPYVKDRSFFEPYFSARLKAAMDLEQNLFDKIAANSVFEKNAGAFMTPELAAAMALGYLIYRKGVPGTDTEAVGKAIHNKELSSKVMTIVIPLIAAGSVIDKMLDYVPHAGMEEKEAGAFGEYVAPIAGTYVYSAYARRKAERGEPISGVEHLFADYPLPLSLGAVAGIKGVKSRIKGTTKKSSGIISDMTKAAQSELLLAMGSGVYRPRLSGVLAFLTDTAIAKGISSAATGAKRILTGNDSERKD